MEAFVQLLQYIRQQTLLLRLWQSGRELLHSNLLAYLLELPIYRPRLLNHLWGDDCDEYHVRALREQNGIDLMVVMLPKLPNLEHMPDNDGYWQWLNDNINPEISARVLVIENKFKSLPDVAQLQGYSEKVHEEETDVFARKLGWYQTVFSLNEVFENESRQIPYLVAACRKVLLTPINGNDITVTRRVERTVQTGNRRRRKLPVIQRGLRQDTWHSRAWRDIANILPQVANEAGLEKEFVQSYARILSYSTKLQEQLCQYADGHTPFATIDMLRQHAQPLRLWDFIDKWRYEFLKRKIQEALPEHGWQPIQCVANNRGISIQFAIQQPQATAVIATFFSRNTGGADISIFRAIGLAEFAMIVQLQGPILKIMFAFGGNAENAQHMAATAGLQCLINLGGRISEVLPVVPEQLGTYTQKVGLSVAEVRRDPAVLEVMQQEGRLIYAGVPMWTWENGQAVGPWANLSCQCIAERIAAIAVEACNNWDAVTNAMQHALPGQ